MLFSPHILLPGPTPIPEAVEQAMMTAMSDHRGHLFEEVKERVLSRLHTLFHLDADGRVAVLPASGTGGLEAVAQNFFRPGDEVLVVEGGLFGQRFGQAAEAMGLSLHRITTDWGHAFDPQTVVAYLERHPVAGVLVTHNETSTGVLNPVDRLAALMAPLTHRPLLMVDSISGVPSVPLDMAQWGVDVVITGSQKGFMCPPGLTMVAASGRAREALLEHRAGRFFFDLTPYFQGNFPYTPALSLWYGLDAALKLLEDEGETARYQRHRRLAAITRAFGQAAGLPPLVAPQDASPTVTALEVLPPLSPSSLRQQVAAKGLQIAGGLGAWHHLAVRIGHVGAVDEADLWAGLGILAQFLSHPEEALVKAFGTWHSSWH